LVNIPHSSRVQAHVVLIAAFTVSALLGGIQIAHNTISFDGGLNAQAARMLAEHGRYATYYNGYRDFDLHVTTGPTVILPTALVFKLAGVTIITAQLPNLLYFILLFILASHFAFRHAGLVGAFLSILLLLATPGLLDKGFRLYGELPAVVFFLAGLLLLDRLPTEAHSSAAFVAGACFGLSFLTKFIMLIPLVPVPLVLVFGRNSSPRNRLRTFLPLAAGFTIPVMLFEWEKLMILTPPTYRQWWRAFTGRAVSQGLPGFMGDTPGILPKLLHHFSLLMDKTNTPMISLGVFLLLPLAVFVSMNWFSRNRKSTPSPSIWILACAAFVQVSWWLLLTPTSRTLLRRVLVGLILQEVFVAVVLAWMIGRAIRAWQTPATSSHGRFIRALAGGIAMILATGTTVYASRNLPASWPSTKEWPGRQDDESMARLMKSLPDRARFYSKGWWRAPILSALSGRKIDDFDLFPMSQIGLPLDQTYLVVDRYFRSSRALWVRKILERTDKLLVHQLGSNSLFRLKRVLPYAPMPRPSSPDMLRPILSAENGRYPYTRGLGPPNRHGRFFADVISGYLLRRDHRPRFVVDLWVARKAGYRPRIIIKMDGKVILSRTVPARHTFRYSLYLSAPNDDPPSVSLVELWLYRDTPISPFTLWHSRFGSLIVQRIGFDEYPRMPNSGTKLSDRSRGHPHGTIP